MFLPPEAYDDFEPHIRGLVKAIHRMGIWTRSSCEGHLDPLRDSCPHVIIDVRYPVSPRKFLREFLKLLGEWNLSGKEKWCLCPHLVYDDGDEPLLLYLVPLENNSRRDPATLQRLHSETEELAEFLLERDVSVLGP